MVDKTEISNPIEIKDCSIERVAFDLMLLISNEETYYGKAKSKEANPREYYLKLYNQCHKTVYNRNQDIDKLLQD
ncbi:hypothetical protein [Acinetobacter junii]|uniref:Uncharacterized protein n=1 Tax=Acinetobacter junii TaxID=40215 RepID=A0AAW5RBY7_ACIJU|nr:hypothetical protein [Acinetobacter junii]MCU4397796.1 hypothetical protein [Acinetobacter junii]MDU6055531.1 hypothetical protein [Acinetobacter junii]MEB8381461.1 hypothetical protein [Acinetobacter junii]